jgi:hypothetical protein
MATWGPALPEEGIRNNAAAKRRVVQIREIERIFMFFPSFDGILGSQGKKSPCEVWSLLGDFIWLPSEYLLSSATPEG